MEGMDFLDAQHVCRDMNAWAMQIGKLALHWILAGMASMEFMRNVAGMDSMVHRTVRSVQRD